MSTSSAPRLPRIAPDGTFVGAASPFPGRLLGHVPTQRPAAARAAHGARTLLADAEYRVLTDGRAAVVVDTLMYSAAARGDMRPALVLGADGVVEAWLGEQKMSGRNAAVLWDRIASSQDVPVDVARARVLAALTVSRDQLATA